MSSNWDKTRAIKDFLNDIGYLGDPSHVIQVTIEPMLIKVDFLKKNDSGNYYVDPKTGNAAQESHMIGYRWDE